MLWGRCFKLEQSLLIHKAIVYATKAHAGQKRKASDVDYISHPMEVMEILALNNASINLRIAGILHDTVEDTQVTIEDIEKNFGSEVRTLVASHTEDKSKTWHERKQHTVDFLKTATLEEKLLALADLIANARSILYDMDILGDDVWSRFKATKEEEEWYYNGILDSVKEFKTEEKYEKLYKEAEKLCSKIFE